MFSRVSLYFREREGEGDREGRKAEGANVSESVVSHFSHLFPLFLLPYRAPLLSGWRCDWQVRGEKTLAVFLRLDKRIFSPCVLLLLFGDFKIFLLEEAGWLE